MIVKRGYASHESWIEEIENEVDICLGSTDYSKKNRDKLIKTCLGLNEKESKSVFRRPERYFELLELPISYVRGVEKTIKGFLYAGHEFACIEDVAKHYYLNLGRETYHTEGTEQDILAAVCRALALNEVRDCITVIHDSDGYIIDTGLMYEALKLESTPSRLVCQNYKLKVHVDEFSSRVRQAVKDLNKSWKNSNERFMQRLTDCAEAVTQSVRERHGVIESSNWTAIRKKDAVAFVKSAIAMLGFKESFEAGLKRKYFSATFDLVELNREKKRFEKIEVKNNDYFTKNQLALIRLWWKSYYRIYKIELCVARVLTDKRFISEMNELPQNPWLNVR